MDKERLLELSRKAYGKGGDTVHDPDLMEACNEIRRLLRCLEDSIPNNYPKEVVNNLLDFKK